MEKKKKKLWKKILLVIVTMVLILLIIAVLRYNTLTKIYEKYQQNNIKSNFYYYSETKDTIIQVWKKDNLIKNDIKQVDGTGHLTFWKNISTGENLVLWNSPEKLYSENKDPMLIEHLPAPSVMGYTEEKEIRFLMSLNLLWQIGVEQYNGKDCYYIKEGESEFFIEKESGLILHSLYNGKIDRKIDYSFDTVTDEDIKKPDLSKYKLIENR